MWQLKKEVSRQSKEGKKAITQQLLFHMCNGSPSGEVATYRSIKTKRKKKSVKDIYSPPVSFTNYLDKLESSCYH